MIYAVKYPGSDRWRIARKVKAAEYGGHTICPPGWDVWSEDGTTAWIGTVGNGEQVVKLEGRNGWKTVALANQATAQSHQARWAAAEALLMMALPHVEAEDDDSLAHEIRRHLNLETREQ